MLENQKINDSIRRTIEKEIDKKFIDHRFVDVHIQSNGKIKVRASTPPITESEMSEIIKNVLEGIVGEGMLDFEGVTEIAEEAN